jgi:DNA-binding transcriptional MerR regulator
VATFPDITISKIRFLESEGLIEPQRTPSGYRKFTTTDLDRLRYVLLAQRDQYLPLKVIKENLDALDRGLQPATTRRRSITHAQRWGLPPSMESLLRLLLLNSQRMRLSREELLEGIWIGRLYNLSELESFGLITIRGRHYDGDSLSVAKAVAEMAGFGIEPRHLAFI